MAGFDPIEALRALRERSKLTMAQISHRMGYKSATGYQRFEEPATYAKRDHLELSEARRLIEALSGKGEPPIQPGEIWKLLNFSDEEKNLNAELAGGTQYYAADIVEDAIYWLMKNKIIQGMQPEEASGVVTLCCDVLRLHPDSDPNVLTTVINLDRERRRRLSTGNGNTKSIRGEERETGAA